MSSYCYLWFKSNIMGLIFTFFFSLSLFIPSSSNNEKNLALIIYIILICSMLVHTQCSFRIAYPYQMKNKFTKLHYSIIYSYLCYPKYCIPKFLILALFFPIHFNMEIVTYKIGLLVIIFYFGFLLISRLVFLIHFWEYVKHHYGSNGAVKKIYSQKYHCLPMSTTLFPSLPFWHPFPANLFKFCFILSILFLHKRTDTFIFYSPFFSYKNIYYIILYFLFL